jgi:hypothetical protein
MPSEGEEDMTVAGRLFQMVAPANSRQMVPSVFLAARWNAKVSDIYSFILLRFLMKNLHSTGMNACRVAAASFSYFDVKRLPAVGMSSMTQSRRCLAIRMSCSKKSKVV